MTNLIILAMTTVFMSTVLLYITVLIYKIREEYIQNIKKLRLEKLEDEKFKYKIGELVSYKKDTYIVLKRYKAGINDVYLISELDSNLNPSNSNETVFLDDDGILKPNIDLKLEQDAQMLNGYITTEIEVAMAEKGLKQGQTTYISGVKYTATRDYC